MTGSQVDCWRPGGSVMPGQISSLQGQQFVAHVRAGGTAFELQANLQIDSQNSTVAGSLQATPGGGG